MAQLRRQRRTGDESVRVAYARHLREKATRCEWMNRGPFARRAADLESGRAVAVRAWEIRQFAPELRCESEQWVRIVGDAVELVQPQRSLDGLRIVAWEPMSA
jgi:hypothetical protein